MDIKLYNTLTRAKEIFKPITPGHAGLYTCGPTVYDYAHIGNLRTYVFEDILKRVLRFSGLTVKHVMNVTDVGHLTSDADEGEDKMALGAQREGKTVWEIAAFYAEAFKKDLDALRILPPTTWCKATDHISEQLDLVRILMEKGYGYRGADGLYFDTSKFPNYGALARKDVEGQIAGARVEDKAGKRHPSDFALWKFSPLDRRRLMEWDSPYGKGFPGWHLECSAMSCKYLGKHFDIHCGGIDHISVHHTNEIAQSEAAYGISPWVNWWMHGEFLVMDKAKMSKSSGEFLTLARLKEKGYSPLDYRYLFLGAHYRMPLAFSLESLDQAKAGRANLMDKISGLPAAAPAARTGAVGHVYWTRFWSCLEDDLNAPRALAVLWDLAKDKTLDPGLKAGLLGLMDDCLGLDLLKPEEKKAEAPLTPQEQALLGSRKAARAAKQWAESDRLRDELLKMGVVVEDTKDGMKWKRK
jgi:cysteinyl-tRNA synthetase